ncbi:MAG: hypothetical protein JXR56_00430 [Candidatus Cloacimonetes bacterium]|nr:hypothetical protein [Candidatus Cloacimonadota bacterium]
MCRLLVVLSLLALLLIGGCSSETTKPEPEKGTLPISLNLAQALAMDYRITRVLVTITRNDYTESLELVVDGETASGTFIDLEPGIYDIIVNLYEDNVIIGTGSGQAEVVVGETTTVTIDIIFNPTTGQLEITVDWSQPVTPPTRVLFIGNSITYYNNGIYFYLENIAENLSPEVDFICDSVTSGGYTLEQHWTGPNAQTTIATGNYDYVVLQERTSWPVDYPQTFYTYVQLFDEAITASGAQTVLFLSPPYQESFDEMLELQAAAYNYIGQVIDASVIAVGRAFQRCRTSNPEVVLYQPDGNHPTNEGTYLAACMFYSAFWNQSAFGSNWDNDGVIDEIERPLFQTIAWETRQLYHR